MSGGAGSNNAANANSLIANLASGIAGMDLEQLEQLSKQSCYDSGIDIREPIPNVQPIPKKTVYSDADIVLSSDWVPPKTIVPTHFSESPPRSSILGQNLDNIGGHRKKTSSVSFSVEGNDQPQPQQQQQQQQSNEKSGEKKNKVNFFSNYFFNKIQ